MKKLLASRYFKGAATLAIGTAFGQLVILAASPFLTRLYEPNEIGDLAAYAALLSTLAVVASLRYQLAIPLPESEEAGRDVLVLSLLVALAFCCVVAGVTFALKNRLAEWTNAEVFRDYFWMLPLSLLGAAGYQALSYWGVRRESYGLLARTKVTQSVGMAGTQTALGFSGAGSIGLLIGDAVGRAAGSGTLLWSVFQRKDEQRYSSVRSRITVVAKRYRRFPLLSSWSGLLNAAGIFSPPLLVAGLFGSSAAGFFALGQRLIAVPVTLVSFSVSQVFFGRAAEFARTSREDLARLVRSTGSRLFILGLLPSATLLLVGPRLFALVFGDPWREAGVLTQMLVPSFLLQFAVVPISQTLNVLERQDVQLIWDAARFVLVVASLLIPALVGLSTRAAVLSYGITSAAAYSCLWYLAVRETRRGHP